MRSPSTWSLALGAVGILSTMPIATIASLFQQNHYAGHDKKRPMRTPVPREDLTNIRKRRRPSPTAALPAPRA